MKNVTVNYSEIQIREEDMRKDKTLKAVEAKIKNLGLGYTVWKSKYENLTEIRFSNPLGNYELSIVRSFLKPHYGKFITLE